MTTIAAKILADSRSALTDHRIVTFEATYPRAIHAEVMTHRVLSRNASSSRAIPVARQIEMIRQDPFIPLFWGKNQKGMQADEECNNLVNVFTTSAVTDSSPDHRELYLQERTRNSAWRIAMDNALHVAEAFNKAGYHKQVVNRLLEPFAHIKIVVTATDWDNFFELRRHKDAEPHFQVLANKMFEAMEESTPVRLKEDEWHLPYVTDEEKALYKTEIVRSVSAARCARTSYLNFDGTLAPLDKDLELCEKLVGSKPLHASPFEHQATPSSDKDEWANCKGFRQYRYELENQWHAAL